MLRGQFKGVLCKGWGQLGDQGIGFSLFDFFNGEAGGAGGALGHPSGGFRFPKRRFGGKTLFRD